MDSWCSMIYSCVTQYVHILKVISADFKTRASRYYQPLIEITILSSKYQQNKRNYMNNNLITLHTPPLLPHTHTHTPFSVNIVLIRCMKYSKPTNSTPHFLICSIFHALIRFVKCINIISILWIKMHHKIKVHLLIVYTFYKILPQLTLFLLNIIMLSHSMYM